MTIHAYKRLPNTPPRYVSLMPLDSGALAVRAGPAEYFRSTSVLTVTAWLASWDYTACATNLYERKDPYRGC